MDRRQQKTREAIFRALSTLLEKKRYNHITVQDIIDEANIGRSTFYAHFETKDELLKTMCADIFGHVFSNDLITEKTHDFSGNNGLEAKLTHILYHLKDSKKDIIGILSCESGDLFLNYFKQYLGGIINTELISRKGSRKVNVPDDFLVNHIAGSFVNLVQWWIKNDLTPSPEELGYYFFEVMRSVI